MFLIGHEFGHSLKRGNPALYRQLSQFILNLAPNRAEYSKKLACKGYTPEQYNDEFVNDFIGREFNSKGFWEALSKEDAGFFRKVARWAIKFLDKTLKKFQGTERDVAPFITDMRAARKALVDILAEYAHQGDLGNIEWLPYNDAELMAGKPRTGKTIQPVGGENHKKAVRAALAVLNGKAEASFTRPDLGEVFVVQGKDGTAEKNFTNGSGINGIITKRMVRGEDAASAVVGAVTTAALGPITRRYGGETGRVDVQYNACQATLSLSERGNKKTWILTGFKIGDGASRESYNPARYAPQDFGSRQEVVASSKNLIVESLKVVNQNPSDEEQIGSLKATDDGTLDLFSDWAQQQETRKKQPTTSKSYPQKALPTPPCSKKKGNRPALMPKAARDTPEARGLPKVRRLASSPTQRGFILPTAVITYPRRNDSQPEPIQKAC